MSDVILDIRDVCKEFPGVQALRDVSLRLQSGEVHGLIGENGAGKSTLMKILAGVYEPTSGTVLFRGRAVRWRGVAESQRGGIAMIHQEFNLVDELSAAENIFLGRERSRFGFVRRSELREEAGELLQRLNSSIEPDQPVRDLSVAEKQLVEIAKAISCNASVLIMDEPTAVLTARETESLFGLIEQLRSQGVTIVYISHILPEVLRICDRITVMRDGQVVRTLGADEVKSVNEKQLASMMVGRPMADHFPPRGTPSNRVLLRVTDVSSGQHVRGVSLEVREGEIVGLAGLVGAGRTELAEAIAGLRKRDGGSVEIAGNRLRAVRPADAVGAGIAYLSEDRKGTGLTLDMNVIENVVMVSLRRYSRGLLLASRQREAARRYVKKLGIRVADLGDPVQKLSGGNQQKVALAKWLETNPRILILDEPTRGVDIGAKEEIYRLIKGLTDSGMGCLMISSELNELLGMCHRIAVMREGRLMGIVDGAAASEESLMHLAAGVGEH